jgi:hypothetical protein
VAGVFVADAVRQVCDVGVEVEVVSPADFRHFGLAFADGIVQYLRAKPWLAAAVPLFLIAYARVARRAARDADVVHAHWIPSVLAALATGRPFVLLNAWRVGSSAPTLRRRRARCELRPATPMVLGLRAAAPSRPEP